MQEKSPAN